MMKALQIQSPGKVSEVEVPAPEISHPGEVRIRVQAVSVSRQPEWIKCSYPCPPGFPGREGTGIVEAAGESVRTISPGDRVLLCRWPGLLYQERILCPEPWVKKIETGAEAAALAPADLFANMLALLKRAEKIFRAVCVVIGLGPSGLAAVMWLRILGARQIWAVEKKRQRREMGLKFGADYVFSTRDKHRIKELKGMGPETVIECSGSHAGMSMALDMAKKEALLSGYNNRPFKVSQSDWHEKNLSIKTQSDFDQKIWDETADYINRSLIDPGRLVTHVFPFSAEMYAQALEKLKSPETVRIVMDLS
jgi:threonine dehydrogenase-like Zn-dependent dehydrogenase